MSPWPSLQREEQIARERALEERQRLMNLRSLEERETRLEEKIAAADKYRANMEAEVADQVAKVSAGAASETNALLQQIEELKTQLEAEKSVTSWRCKHARMQAYIIHVFTLHDMKLWTQVQVERSRRAACGGKKCQLR
eukprot:SAG31_NODE_504_length_14762_cov_3.344609_10_plen_139_part_00